MSLAYKIATFNPYIAGEMKFTKKFLLVATDFFLDRDWNVIVPYYSDLKDRKKIADFINKDPIFKEYKAGDLNDFYLVYQNNESEAGLKCVFGFAVW